MSAYNDSHPLLLFDGVCNLCNGAVQFIIDRDDRDLFRFASLQSELGRSVLRKYDLDSTSLDTVVLVQKGRAYTHSEAALRTAAQLDGGYRLLSVFRILPRFFRDGVYRFIARNRYRWFGREEACRLPRPEWQAKFVG
ncbi:MAG: thiol-disulfide oxidoreductase DCC family protein [Saprospiraceae bacterium]